MQLLKKKIIYRDPAGNELTGYNYYVLVNGIMVAIKPAFNKDYRLLSCLASNYETYNKETSKNN